MMEWKKFQPADFTEHVNCARLILAGIDTQRLSRRIRHPQALNHKGEITEPNSPHSAAWLMRTASTLFSGAWVGSQRISPRLCLSFVGHCLAATRSAFVLKNTKVSTMIYTFIIAQPWQKIAQLKRVRTVSAYGRTEAEARRAFKGLPLVLKSRTPDNQEDAA